MRKATNFDLVGADNIAAYCKVGVPTLVTTWRRLEPPPPMVKVDHILLADSTQMAAWMKQMDLSPGESHG